jgi:dihydrolipoamide dehydrogenase
MDEVKHFADLGVSFGAPRSTSTSCWRTRTRWSASSPAAWRDGQDAQGHGGARLRQLCRPAPCAGGGDHRRRAGQDRQDQTVQFKQRIIAAGSQAVRLPFLPDDPRIVDSTGALQLRQVPKRMLVIGGGIIGLEMGTVYSTLGARLDVVEMLDGLMQGADRDLVKVWQKMNAPRFDNMMLKTKTVGAEATPTASACSSRAWTARRARASTTWCCRPWAAAPTASKIGADKAGVAVTERGFIPVDVQMRTNVPHIFAIGDIVGQPMLAHKAVHEAHVAAEVAAGELLGDASWPSAPSTPA